MLQAPPIQNRVSQETQAWLSALERYRALKASGWNGMTPRGHELEKWVQKQRTLHNQKKLLEWKRAALCAADFDFQSPRAEQTSTDQDHAHALVLFYREHGHYSPTQTHGGAALTKWWARFRASKGAQGLLSGTREDAQDALRILQDGIADFTFDAPCKSEINESRGLSFNGFSPTTRAEREPPQDLALHLKQSRRSQALDRNFPLLVCWESHHVLRDLVRRAALFGQVLRVGVHDNDRQLLRSYWLTDLKGSDGGGTLCHACPWPSQDDEPHKIFLPSPATPVARYFGRGAGYGAWFGDTLVWYDVALADQTSVIEPARNSSKGSRSYRVRSNRWVMTSLIEGTCRRMSSETTANERFQLNLEQLRSWVKKHSDIGRPHVVWTPNNPLFKFLEHMVRKMDSGKMSFSHAEQLAEIDATWGKDRRSLADLFGDVLHPDDRQPV